MRIRRLQLREFRPFVAVDQELHPGLNIITGGNGAGKTSLLESIAVLSRGRSHRTAAAGLARNAARAWLVQADLIARESTAPADRISVRWADGETRIEQDHRSLTIAELVRKLPTLLLDPQSHRLIEDAPTERRRLLDWGVFHVEQSYAGSWARFHRTLRQRNAALRNGTSDIEPWTRELVSSAAEVVQARDAYVEQLRVYFADSAGQLKGNGSLSLRHQQGWPADRSYDEVLRTALEGDCAHGHTRYGPHRADLQVLSDNQGARGKISRGEQKLAAAALLLAQARFCADRNASAPVLLVDDFEAELSSASQQQLAEALRSYRGQKLISSLTAGRALASIGDHAMFHVEHGNVNRTI